VLRLPSPPVDFFLAVPSLEADFEVLKGLVCLPSKPYSDRCLSSFFPFLFVSASPLSSSRLLSFLFPSFFFCLFLSGRLFPSWSFSESHGPMPLVRILPRFGPVIGLSFVQVFLA